MTNDTKKVFAVIYYEYKRRRESGIAKADAIEFENSSFISEKLGSIDSQDVDSALDELNDLEYIMMNVAGGFSFENKGIEFRENLPLNTVKEIVDFASKLIH